MNEAVKQIKELKDEIGDLKVRVFVLEAQAKACMLDHIKYDVLNFKRPTTPEPGEPFYREGNEGAVREVFLEPAASGSGGKDDAAALGSGGEDDEPERIDKSS